MAKKRSEISGKVEVDFSLFRLIARCECECECESECEVSPGVLGGSWYLLLVDCQSRSC
jgi:hypothetical protein